MLNKEKIIEIAKSLGFDLIGFTKAEKLDEEIDALQKWLDRGYQAGMKYMEQNLDKRRDVCEILSEAKSVISLAVNYNKYENSKSENIDGKVSQYAWGKDYHYIIWEKLEQFENKLNKLDPAVETKSYVDTGPVMDKAWAQRAGIGWIGKHSNIISREYGSWLFLANIFINKDFEYDNSAYDLCGSCTKCIDACPTDAIKDGRLIDSNKCISFLTIENKNDISDDFINKFDGWAFGCDICQEVCPWNIKFDSLTEHEEFQSFENKTISLGDLEGLSNRKFGKKFFESPLKRARLKGMKRNLEFLEKGKVNR